MKPQRKFATSAQKTTTYLCTVTKQDNGEPILVCQESDNREEVNAEITNGQKLAKIIQDYQSSGKKAVFAPQRNLVSAPATLTPPVPGVHDNYLQYQMTTQDGLTIFLREWLKPNNGTSPLSRKHPNTTQSVLFLPGFPHASMLVWKFQVTNNVLAQKYRMITMEIRGHGDSSKPVTSADFTEQKWADDIQDAINLLQLSKVALVSHSHGGTVLTHYLNVYGDSGLAGIALVSSFTKLDLTNPAFGDEALDPKAMAVFPGLLNLNNDLGDYYRANLTFGELSFWNSSQPNAKYRDAVLATDMMVPPATRQAMFFPPRFVNNSVLGTVVKPALVVHAKDNCGVNKPSCTKSRDDLILVQHAINNYNLLKQNSTKAKLEIMDGVGHFPQAECPDAFNPILMQFLKGL